MANFNRSLWYYLILLPVLYIMGKIHYGVKIGKQQSLKLPWTLVVIKSDQPALSDLLLEHSSKFTLPQ